MIKQKSKLPEKEKVDLGDLMRLGVFFEGSRKSLPSDGLQIGQWFFSNNEGKLLVRKSGSDELIVLGSISQ